MEWSPAPAFRWLFSRHGAADRLIPRWLFLRTLGLIYFSTFFPLLFQIRGLTGPDGILPANESQIERFAPGFRDCILARRVFSPADLERMDANLVGGDIAGGAMDIPQMLFRPTWRHYATSAKDIYLCSASTPPGGARCTACAVTTRHEWDCRA